MTDKIIVGNQEFIIRLIDESDFSEVFKLFKACPDYFEIVSGEEADEQSVNIFYEALPPNKDYEDKYSIGVYSKSHLVGVIDLVKDFPKKGTWMLGLMLITPEFRNLGLGKGLHEYIKEIARVEEVNQLRVGVVMENTRALEYWKAFGYIEEKRTEEVISLNLVLD